MALKADFHLHSSFSGDSDAPMEEIIKKAISLGLTHICFTEHYDPDFVYPAGESGTFELNTDSYLYDLLRFREKYYGQIQIMFGVELGLQPHLRDALEFYTENHDFDFIIGSSHICNRKDLCDLADQFDTWLADVMREEVKTKHTRNILNPSWNV